MSDYYLGMSSKILPDYAKVFKPAPYVKFVSKLIDAASTNQYAKYYINSWNGNTCAKYSDANVDKFSKFITRTLGNLYVKMLACTEDEPCSYHEIYHRLLEPKGKPFGNDVESFKNLEINGLVEIDHLGKYKRKYMRLTPLGRIVLENAKKNDVAYKVLRHFMKFKDDFDTYLIEVNFNIETMDDISPNSFVAMLAAILDDNSVLHEIGSYAYWCSKLLDSLKKNERFFEIFNCPEVNEYLDNNSSNSNVQNFKKVLSKISKKYVRKAA